MKPTIYELIQKIQQKIDVIDDAISYKREIILRGSTDEALKSKVRGDIRGLLEERKQLNKEQLEMKLITEKINTKKSNNYGKNTRKEARDHGRDARDGGRKFRSVRGSGRKAAADNR